MKCLSQTNREATAQGKQGIWMFTFPDRENTGNLVNLILTQGKAWQHRKNCVLVVESLTCNVIVTYKKAEWLVAQLMKLS